VNSKEILNDLPLRSKILAEPYRYVHAHRQLAKELRFAFPDGPHEPSGIKDIEAVAD
jgi:hypothetical protein